MTPPVTRAVYRELVRNAHVLDRHAAVKALISPTEVSNSAVCQEAVSKLLGQKMYYMPSKSALSVVREAFRSPPEDVDAAFMAVRYLGEKLALAREFGVLKDNAAPPARTYGLLDEVTASSTSSVALTSRIRSGVFLIAHPLLYRPFEQAVILITNHGKKGTTGFVVNERGDKKHTLWPNYRLDEQVQPIFGSHAVFYGGPVDGGFVQFIHTQPNVGGTLIEARHDPTKLYVGGNLLDFAELDNPKPHEVVFFNGYAGWTPNMLQKELEMGSWIMVQAPLSLALRPPPNVWRYLLKELGGEYEEFGTIPRNLASHVHLN